MAALPPTVKLDAISEKSVQEQLLDILQEHGVKLIDLFREWDDDGNGALDKKELRQAVAALGYDAPRKDVDSFFDIIDADHSGWIEFEELKKALSEKGVKDAQKRIEVAAAKEGRQVDRSGYEKPTAPAVPRTAPARPARRAPEPPSREVQMLYARNHQICGFLAQNNCKLIDLFKEWDSDKNGALDKGELKKALTALGYYASPAEIDDVFAMIDASGDGLIDFAEWKRALNAFLKGQPPSPRLEPEPPSARPPSTHRASPRFAADGGAGMPMGDAEGVLGSLPIQESPGELVIQPRGQHTHTIIFLHPAGVKAETYLRLYRRFGNLAVHYRFVFPRAPMRVAKWHWSVGARGDGLSCWFLPMLQDQRPTFIHGFYQEGERGKEEEVAKEQMDLQAKRIRALIDREAKLLNGHYDQIVLGGTSQGGSLAAHVALSLPTDLSALICCRTIFLARFMQLHERHTRKGAGDGEVPGLKHKKMPIFVFAGGSDGVHPLQDTRESFARLSTDAGYQIEWHVEPNLGHSEESLNEQRYVAYWAARASLGTKKAFDPSAIDSLRRLLVVKPEGAPAAETPRPRSGRVHKKVQPPSMPPRPSSGQPKALPHTHTQALNLRQQELNDDMSLMPRVHPLMREPEWRGGTVMGAPLGGSLSARAKMPEWDSRPLGGLAPPLSLGPR